jgi:S-DNA-T family DNA segregation ATPase FtsK/SpoIIIE
MSMHRAGVYQPRSRRSKVNETLASARAFVTGLVFEGLRRALGLCLLLLALGMFAALVTYDASDPSFNVATWRLASNWMGANGAYGADFLFQAVGWAAFGLPLPLAVWGIRFLSGSRPHGLLWLWRVGALASGSTLLSGGFGVPAGFGLLPALAGGVTGQLLWVVLSAGADLIGVPLLALVAAVACLASGAWLVLKAAGLGWRSVGTALSVALSASMAVAALVRRALPKKKARAAKQKEEKWYADEEESENENSDERAGALADEDGDDPPWLSDRPERFGSYDPTQKRVRRSEDKKRKPNLKTRLQPALNLAEGEYQLPPLSLLKEPPTDATVPAFSDDALEENARLLEAVLGDFGVRGRIVAVRPGPVVTLYELEPAAGVKSSRVISLSDDIARSMSAVAARVAVIPGRNVIGIELPNLRRETVYLRELFSAPEYEKSRAPLTLALGKTIGGEPVMADLAKMPHLLIAGTTGSGKSVALNTMILSLLYRMPPEHCRIIMIDPKMLELSVYDNIPHLLAPVVIDPKKAVVALKWAVREMEQRYAKMAKIGARGVEAFNERVKAALDKGDVLKRTVQTGFDRETGKPIYEDEVLELEPMPYIVVVVDEMADLMMISGKEIEGAVQRLAQMARAAGIHLIAATQRPSVDVITGTIKANFPTRISFQVTSKIDSRTILGEQGAEQLLGQGDMLYMMAGGRIRRVHGPFVSDSEVEDVVRFLKTQGQPDYLDAVTEEPDEDEEDSYDMYSGESGDELYDKAIAVVANERKVSTSYIQRRLQIGYNRAARLIERMEEDGMISKPNHQGKREILLPEGRQ